MRRDIEGIEFAEIPLSELFQSGSGFVDEYMYLQEIKDRKLFLKEEITVESVDHVVRNILKYNAEDRGKEPAERKPILLYISSDGGDVDSGFELIDVIENSKTPVYIINLGYCYSMAFIIFCAGHKRYASKNAKFLMHDGNSVIGGSTGKAQDTMDFAKRIEKKIREFILDKTNISYKEYMKNLRKEWYMFVDEAKAKGIVDGILGVDVDIDAIS